MHAHGMRPQPPQRTLLMQPESIIARFFCDRTYCPSKAPYSCTRSMLMPDVRLFLTRYIAGYTHNTTT